MRWLLLVMPLFIACESSSSRLPPGAQRFKPPEVYDRWWELTEQCSGRSGHLSDVTWYRVPGTTDIPLGDGTLVSGRWDSEGNRIVLSGESVLEGDLVRHEMLHALLQTPRHERTAFVGRCRGTVVCTGQCVEGGGRAAEPDPAAIAVSPNALEIGVEVVPDHPGLSVDDGNFVMIVTARNPASAPVVVKLPPSGDAGPSLTFAYRITSGSNVIEYNTREEAPEDATFAPLEVKRFLFDFRVGRQGNRYVVPAGTFRFDGSYGGVWAPRPLTVTVLP